MTTYHAPLEDIGFMLTEVLELERLRATPAHAALDRGMIESVLREGARFAEDVLSPINGPGDLAGSKLVDGRVEYSPGFVAAFERYAADGWLGVDLPERCGGQALPRVLQAAFAEMTNAANLAFSMLPVTIRAAARLLLAHGEPDLVESYVPAMIRGECTATIVITEPQAGSDVGRTSTLATPQPDGGYRVSGTKCFISNGDNEFAAQIAHLVLARTPGAAAGTRGLSLFLVPKFRIVGGVAARNGVSVSRVENKMGLKASPTCVIDFADAHGIRIGSEGRGLQSMFAMVNTMRLETAMQGVAIGAAATARAVRYALERRQGGAADAAPRPIIEHPDVRRMLLTMRARIEALRGLVLEAALQLDLGEGAAQDADRKRALGFAQWLLPICKAYATDIGFEVANTAIQVFGGHGYVTESGVEQYVRDVRVAGIYEGTNGIQAIDLVARKLIADRGERLAEYLARMRGDLAAGADDPQLAAIRDALNEGTSLLERVSTALLERAAAGRSADVEAAAVAYLRLAGLVGCAWMWLRIAARAAGSSALHRGKRATARFFAEQLMPEAKLYAEQALGASASSTALDEQLWMAGL